MVENDPNVRQTLDTMNTHLAAWWKEAQADFARLAPEAKVFPEEGNGSQDRFKESAGTFLALKGHLYPEVRRTLINSLKKQIVPVGVLDEFQVAGVFVNWWDGIKYDLKTILTNGWSPTLIPDRYLVAAFFQKEAQEIEDLEASCRRNGIRPGRSR